MSFFSCHKNLIPVLFLLAALATLAACGPKASSEDTDLLSRITTRGKLVAGVKFDSKPFGYLDTDGQLKGFDIDLIREIATRLGKDIEPEFQQVISSTRVIALDAGNVDLVAATMTITEDRKKVIDFSDVYYTAHQKVIVPDQSPVKGLDDLNNRIVLFVMGTTGEKNIKARLPEAKYVGFKAYTDAFSALSAGRGDALTTDDTILSGFLAEHCGFRLLDEKLSEEPYGIGYKKSPATKDLQNRVNAILSEMKADGSLDKIRARWVDVEKTRKDCK